MKTVVVASSKGGVGKTTLATHLAAQSALSGRRTVLVDADPQGSSTRWCERRAELESAVLPVDGTRKAWRKRIPDDTQQMVVDAPAGFLTGLDPATAHRELVDDALVTRSIARAGGWGAFGMHGTTRTEEIQA